MSAVFASSETGWDVGKMTAHAELAVNTTLREAYSDGSPRFIAKTLQA